MTDIYIAYSRQDRDRLRVVGDLLAQEGWDIWMDPAEPTPDLSPIADLKLGWSKAILVMWSDGARRSEYVRSEAATGLYKNKLVQARIDGDPAPRPYDELETVDLSRWNGDSGDPNWVRLVAMMRNCAGDPARAPAAKRAPPPPAPPVARKPEAERPAPPRYVEAPQAARFVEPAPRGAEVCGTDAAAEGRRASAKAKVCGAATATAAAKNGRAAATAAVCGAATAAAKNGRAAATAAVCGAATAAAKNGRAAATAEVCGGAASASENGRAAATAKIRGTAASTTVCRTASATASSRAAPLRGRVAAPDPLRRHGHGAVY